MQFRTHCSNRERPGSIGLALILLLPVLLLALGLAITAAELADARTEARTSADASALAAALVLVDDRRLVGRDEDLLTLIGEARAAADQHAALNPILGQPLGLAANPNNDPGGDVVFAALAHPEDQTLVAPDLLAPGSFPLARINAVRVTARRQRARGTEIPLLGGGPLRALASQDLVVWSTATFDQHVLGLRPPADIPMPLVPIALPSDPRRQRRDSWEFQAEGSGGSDQWSYDRANRVFVPGSDGLPEVRVHLGHGGHARLLFLGTQDPAGIARQLLRGVSRADLAAFQGELVPRSQAPLLEVPGGELPLEPTQRASLQQALTVLQQRVEARIWPLSGGVDEKTGQVIVSGFVAARLVRVEPDAEGKGLDLLLQPAMLATCAAITGRTQAGEPGKNRYLGKVRLVE